MGGHHKKNLRAEKAKVKLKGVKLPKGLNVTKTEFKVRKINIRTQLKQQEFIAGQRQINLKETLTRLKHPNSTFRLEALRSLREAINAAHAGIRGNLADIVQAVAAICLDIDTTTRRESFKTLSSLLAAIPIDAITPFFHIISSYLRCAMTHIQTALQDDALLMLDVLLQHVPQLVAAHSTKILQNFLEMISRVRAEGERAERTLTVNLGQKQTTIKWRAKVLQRLQHMLKTFVEHKRSRSVGVGNVANITVSVAPIHTFNMRLPQYYALKRCIGSASQVCDLSSIFKRGIGIDGANTATTTSSTTSEEMQLLRNYVEHLMPLLLESWLEVRPQTTTNANSAHQLLLSADAALTLQIVLEIIICLWKLIELHEQQTQQNDLSEWFQQHYAAQFVVNFLQTTAYPYQQMGTTLRLDTKKAKKAKQTAKKESIDQHCLQQNVSIAYLLCWFHTARRGGAIATAPAVPFKMALQFLTTLISNAAQLKTLDDQRTLVLALRAYLLDNAVNLLQLNQSVENTRQLLRATMQAFRNNEFAHKDGVSGNVLALLCEIAQNPNLLNTYGSSEFDEFLKQLPQLLIKPTINIKALVAMSNLGKQKNITFLRALADVAPAVVENLQKIQVQGASNAFEGKRHIMNLFYWMEQSISGTKAALHQKLVHIMEQHITDKRLISYLQYTLM